jgi:hypothetical protein
MTRYFVIYRRQIKNIIKLRRDGLHIGRNKNAEGIFGGKSLGEAATSNAEKEMRL